MALECRERTLGPSLVQACRTYIFTASNWETEQEPGGKVELIEW